MKYVLLTKGPMKDREQMSPGSQLNSVYQIGSQTFLALGWFHLTSPTPGKEKRLSPFTPPSSIALNGDAKPLVLLQNPWRKAM